MPDAAQARSDAYCIGYHAQVRGDFYQANPHPEYTDKWRDWNKGYEAAERDSSGHDWDSEDDVWDKEDDDD